MKRHLLPALVLLASATSIAAAPAQTLEATPTLQGFSAERLERIGEVLQREIENDVIPGAVTLIARHGRIVHLQAHGFRDAEKSEPLREDAVFRAFSMTKPMVSVAAMMLVEQGEMSLRDPVTDWLPEFEEMQVVVAEGEDGALETEPAARPITLQDLLRHTAGFTYAGSAPYPALQTAYREADVEARESDLSPEDFLSRLAAIPLAYQPGTRWEYGLSTDVLGVLLERASGQPLHELLEEMIFVPLGMTDTAFQLRPGQEERLADALDADPQKAGLWQWARVERDPMDRYRLGGAGTVTTAQDFFRFAQMLLSGGELDGVRLLSRKSVELMLSDHIAGLEGSPYPTTGPGYGFGLGFGVRLQQGVSWVPGSPGDAMWAGAGGTSFTLDPQEGIVGVFMAAAPSPRLHTRFLFKNLLYAAVVE